MPELILYLLLIAAFIFSIFASINVKGTFRKYNKMPSSRGVSAADIARQILDSNGLYNVQVTRVSGELTDHYDPRTNTVALSAPVYDSVSVGAIGVVLNAIPSMKNSIHADEPNCATGRIAILILIGV